MTVTRRISKIIKDGIEYNIVGGGSEAVDTQLDPNSENPVQNKVIKAAIDAKLDAPAAAGSTGQFVRKGADGNEWVSGDLASIGEDYSAMRGPAPEGFHVPLSTEWQAIYDAYTGLGLSGSTNFSTYLKLPKAGFLYFGDLTPTYRGSYGYYWSSSPNGTNSAYNISISSNVYPQASNLRSSGYTVRCIKDSPVIPTASWTKLYGTSIESGGIFWSSDEGLISLSSDGQTWITIQDKNLGATQVWNSGDALSEANCGKYYQWGNNYGFPRTGITTSSTQVDVTGYGPGNYYSSSTWITVNPRQSSANDGNNLRGGETGAVTTQLTVGEDKIGLATEESDGFMSFSDKKKLGNMKEFYQVDVLVLGGGGGGGGGSLTSPSMSTGGGGGAGELKIIEGLSLAKKEISVSIGSGGAGGAYGASQAGRGTNGGNSKFGIISALGGGGGGGAMNGFNASIVKGGDGGNGGGMGGNACCANSTCLSGMVGQALGNGNPGGWGTIISPTNPMTNGGGGGGVGGPGGIPSFTPNGVSSLYRCQYAESIGGKGIATCFGGTLRCLGGGGGAGGNRTDILAQCGGNLYNLCFINSIYNGKFYGGGEGGTTNSWAGKAGTANSGGGGGAGFSCRSSAKGGAGGSGLVMVRYPSDGSYGIKCATGGTITTPTINGVEYVVHTFTSGGTFCITG